MQDSTTLSRQTQPHSVTAPRRRLILCLGIVSVLGTILWAVKSFEPTLQPTSDNQEIRRLIQALSATVAPPLPGARIKALDRETTDDANRVRLAQTKIASYGVAAIPLLIDALDDTSHSYTTLDVEHLSLSVGQSARQVLTRLIEVEGPRYKYRDSQRGEIVWPPTCSQMMRESSGEDGAAGAKKWCQLKTGMTLKQIQIEFLQWAIAKEKSVGFASPREEELFLFPRERKLFIMQWEFW